MKERMEDTLRGTKCIGRAIDPKESKPLTHIKRTGEGEQGYATRPDEIDKRVKKAWNVVYECNVKDLKLASALFISKYIDFILKA